MKKFLSLALALALALCLCVPALAAGEPAGSASGEASSDEPYPMFDEYKDYLYETMMQDSFWQGNEDSLVAALEAAETPDDESIQNFTGSGDVDQAPEGVVFPMTYDDWYAVNGGAAGSVVPGEYTDGENTLVIADDLTFTCETAGEDMDGNAFTLIISGTVAEDGTVAITGLTDGAVELIDLASEDQLASNYEVVEALVAQAMASDGASAEPAGGVDEAAYQEYLHQWLIAEDEVNDTMTEDIRENEFMPLIYAGDYETFPAEMLWSGMLENGSPMTYEEFVAAGGVY